MARRWMIETREAQYATINEAAKAADVSVTLLELIESGSVTLPRLARRIGDAYHMDPERVQEITSTATAARLEREARMTVAEKRRIGMNEIYG